jgi:hypothetical protein
MSIYSPPTQNVAIFDTELFNSSDNTITQGQADKRYLRFPVAQGDETLQAIEVNGVATFDNNIVQVGDFNIAQTTTTNTANTLKASSVTSNWGTTLANPTLTITDSVSTNTIRMFPNLPAGNYNQIVQANDRCIIGNGGSLVATVAGGTGINTGIRINSTSTTIGYGSLTSTPDSAVACNATTVVVRPSLTFPDNKVQNSAFTGGTPGTYTNTNMTIDANGKISAISNGTVALPFAPRAANYSDYQNSSGSGAYSLGTKVTCGGTWGEEDYIILRVTAQGNWKNTGTGWENFAVTSGQLIFRPYYAPAGSWAGVGPGSGTQVKYTTNSGNSNIGSIGKALYYTGAINNGTQNSFYISATNKVIQFGFTSPSATGGWNYTHLIEYITRSPTGGTVTFTDGTGTNATNNSLP